VTTPSAPRSRGGRGVFFVLGKEISALFASSRCALAVPLVENLRCGSAGPDCANGGSACREISASAAAEARHPALPQLRHPLRRKPVRGGRAGAVRTLRRPLRGAPRRQQAAAASGGACQKRQSVPSVRRL